MRGFLFGVCIISALTATGYDVGYKTNSYDMKCMESKNCNKTTTTTLLGYEFKVVTSCCNTDNCTTEANCEENDFEFIRRCGKAAECSRVGTYRSNSKKFAINTTCCNSSMCVPPVPTFPTQEATENGLSCPTCFASNSIRCTEEDAMKCVGNENRCIHYVKNEYFKNNWQVQSFSGCTTDSICRLGSSTKQFYYLTNGTFKTVTMEMTCSGSMRVTVQFFSYVVIIFVGLRTIIVAL
ncbi:urokinase plasminogen activator surface receptor-like [Xenopus laevis]|uniref:Urokinase plasminogen activator surface receptor-like n=1 Tax=Xenopus laevis TaxID=8355 RepID=A0A8J1LAS0_XENLA|nr:urokinase plasminogen activator surface receptor-like [Xenopus laevis]